MDANTTIIRMPNYFKGFGVITVAVHLSLAEAVKLGLVKLETAGNLAVKCQLPGSMAVLRASWVQGEGWLVGAG